MRRVAAGIETTARGRVKARCGPSFPMVNRPAVQRLELLPVDLQVPFAAQGVRTP